MKIYSRWDGEKVIYESEKKNIKDVVIEAKDRGSDLSGSNLSDSDLSHAKFYGLGDSTKIKKTQIESFFEALGIIVEE